MKQESSMLIPSRTLRYSGKERPAWRMNQTGGREGVWPVAAAISGASDSRDIPSIMNQKLE